MAYCQLLFLRSFQLAIAISLLSLLASFLSNESFSTSLAFFDDSYNSHLHNNYWIDSKENSEYEEKSFCFVYSHCFQLDSSFSFFGFREISFFSIKFFHKFSYHNLPPPLF